MLVVASLSLAACSGGGSPDPSGTAPGIWAAQVAQVLHDDPSTFHSKVLGDGKITDEEYRQAQDQFAQCLADQGVVAKFSADPAAQGYTLYPSDDHPKADVDAAERKCAPGTIDGVQSLYHGMRANPTGLDQATLAKQCLKDHELTDFAGMSDAEFAKGIDDNSLKATTPQGAVCLLDPTGQSGVTPDQAWQNQEHPHIVSAGG